MTVEQVTEFLGWASLLNVGIISITALLLLGFKSCVFKLHQKMFDMDTKTLDQAYFHYLAMHKLLTLVFFVVPYLVLKGMG